MFELGGGRVVYDGADIATMSREKLRRSLSIIPQEPLMFSGTLRANLDPYAEQEDSALWSALQKVGLKEHAESMKGGLDAYVDGTTSEWSLGQKQLLCLARAALTSVPVSNLFPLLPLPPALKHPVSPPLSSSLSWTRQRQIGIGISQGQKISRYRHKNAPAKGEWQTLIQVGNGRHHRC